MTKPVDLFFSLRSPYSYIAVYRLIRVLKDCPTEVTARVVYPLQLRAPEFVAPEAGPLFGRYVLMDSQRVARRLKIPFAFPVPDVFSGDPAVCSRAADHPRLQRLVRLCAAAQIQGRSLGFVTELMQTLWSGSSGAWDKGDALAGAASRAGLDLADMERAIRSSVDRHDAVVAANEAALLNLGHWGVPTFGYESQPFFGQDRIEDLVWALAAGARATGGQIVGDDEGTREKTKAGGRA